MNDQMIMDTILSTTKGACDLMMHGAIESATPAVHSTFSTAFDNTLTMQNEIYAKMSEMGYFPSQQVESQKITAAKTKFAGGCQ